MLLAILLIAVAILFCTSLGLFLLLRKFQDRAEHQYNNSQFWYGKWRDSEEAFVKLSEQYDALDQGNDEIEENYQQEMLSLYDQIDRVQQSNESWIHIAGELEQIRLDHDSFCLPQLGTDFYPMFDDGDTPLYDALKQG